MKQGDGSRGDAEGRRKTELRPEEPFPDLNVEELWSIEAERRWQEIESGAAQTIPWEEVRARLFRRG
jgi:hypothetical protein